MADRIFFLAVTAAGVGFVHTILGPDHYLPFAALARARGWSTRRTVWTTLLCGLGHVASSVVIAVAGIALGMTALRLDRLESLRGDLAAWMLLAFGITYFTWGVVRAIRNRSHVHAHSHAEGIVHRHEHTHSREHAHPHGAKSKSLTPWILFTIFVFGPCEPLIPLVMYSAVDGDPVGVVVVTGAFAFGTIATMLAAVLAGYQCLSRIAFAGGGRYAHAIAGFVILMCGITIVFLGL